MNKLSAFIKLIRPLNCAMMGLAVLVGAVMASLTALQINYMSAIYGFLTGFMLTAGAMAINDYYDRKIDAVNEPTRPIPSGIIKPSQALIFVGILTIIGLTFAYLSSPYCLVVAAVAWIITFSYVTFGKSSGLPGNFLVSICVALPFIYGGLAITGTLQFNVLLFALMAFLSNTGREITKGIVDVKGDSAEGVKTLAVRYGEKAASIAATIFFLSAVALTPIPVIFGVVSFWFIPFVLVTDIGLIVCSISILKNPSRENARKIKKMVLFLFIFGLLAFIFGSL